MQSWRRERDSNPRNPFEFGRFPSDWIKPLSHLSVLLMIANNQPIGQGMNPAINLSIFLHHISLMHTTASGFYNPFPRCIANQ